MKNLFVITASNPSAKKHIESTVNAPVPPSKVEKHFTGSELARVKAIGSTDGYYAWGSVPGDRNTSTWERMQVGDHVLIYQNQTYTYYTKVLLKAQNSGFAVDNWGFDPQHRTWEYIYFLEKPLRFSNPVYSSALADYLPTRYMGFTQITNERLSKIESDHGSLEAYLEKAIPDFDPHHHRSRGYWWVNQGKTYSEERAGGFLWAPNRDRGGGVPVHWSTMNDVRDGDVVFNYANGSIRAVSTTKGSSYDYENQIASADWDRHGQRVDLEYHEIEPLPLTKIQPFIKEITGRIESGNSPYDSTGGIKQGYLFNYSLEAARIIRRIHGAPFPEPVESYLTETEDIPLVQGDPVINLILAKKQVIFYGPPGTGKTYNARNMTMLLLGPGLHSETVSSRVPPQPAGARSWIFQANPTRYDLVGALSDPSHRETTWTVNQHRDGIRSGDRAFIWMSGPRAGIYAVADITSDPHMVSGVAEEDRYWRSLTDMGVSRLAVGISITRNLVRHPILKNELLGMPQLRDLEILKFAQATNFAVTHQQTAAILKLVESRSTS